VRRPEAAGGIVIEPFNPDWHDRTNFSSGVEQVDNFFRRTAGKLARADNLRLFVLICDDGALAGYYGLNAFSIDYRGLPHKYARTRPRHGQIPVAFIAMIGVDKRYQNCGYGGLLLADAVNRAVRISRDIGIAAVMLDVLDCGDPVQVERRKTLYMRYGFEPLPDQPLRLFLPLTAVSAARTNH
jgi:GNAT superfamily N-acetyltransferase